MLRSSHDACGCSTQPTSTINLKRSTLQPHEGQADRPNTPSDSAYLGSNPGPPANKNKLVKKKTAPPLRVPSADLGACRPLRARRSGLRCSSNGRNGDPTNGPQ